MNRTSSIAGNCRSILREHYCKQRSCNHISESGTILQQGCSTNISKPCHPILTNPFHSLYGVDNLRVPLVPCEEPSYCNTLLRLSPTMSSKNYIRHANCINRNAGPMQCIENRRICCGSYLSTPSDNCIQTITNSIIHKVRCKIPQEEVSLLCCCLPSLIRQLMCKSPWLTPSDIIQWLSEDIIKESMYCFGQVDANVNNDIRQPNQDHHSAGRLSQQRKDNKSEDNHPMQASEDDNGNLSPYQSGRSAASTDPFSSQHPSRSVLDVPSNTTKNKRQNQGTKENQSRTPSTRSFTSQQSQNPTSDSHHSDADNQSKISDRNPPVHLGEDARSFTSRDEDPNSSVNSTDAPVDFDRKNSNLNPKSESLHSSSRIHIDFPGKKDPNAVRDVEKCLAFYQKIRDYFDDDVAAMLLKCCLCYGDCSGKK